MIDEHQDFIPIFCVYTWDPKQMLWYKQKTGRVVDGIGAHNIPTHQPMWHHVMHLTMFSPRRGTAKYNQNKLRFNSPPLGKYMYVMSKIPWTGRQIGYNLIKKFPEEVS